MTTRVFVAALLVSALILVTAHPAAMAHDVKIYAAAVVKTPLAAVAAEYENATGMDTSGFLDPARGATVGTHFMKVIETLGVKDDVLRKVRFSRDGVETVHLVVEGIADLGVSQSSEIVQASPDSLAGPFPGEFALTTDFSLWRRNNISPAVADLVTRLTGPAGREKLAAEGVIPAPVN
jgi:ABC-type molybdate transport system substrate-binding protein